MTNKLTKDNELCVECNQQLTKHVENIYSKDCCCTDYSERGFSMYSDCFCESKIIGQKYLLTCDNCNKRKCKLCGDLPISVNDSFENNVCEKCSKQQAEDKHKRMKADEQRNTQLEENQRLNKNMIFEKWKSSSIEEKLNMYGTIKLKRLAKLKNIKGYSKLSKYKLIQILCPITTNKDFPIK
ncbi:MAG: hypothetical protein ACK5XN_37750 [Bacteroidota bacterium]